MTDNAVNVSLKLQSLTLNPSAASLSGGPKSSRRSNNNNNESTQESKEQQQQSSSSSAAVIQTPRTPRTPSNAASSQQQQQKSTVIEPQHSGNRLKTKPSDASSSAPAVSSSAQQQSSQQQSQQPVFKTSKRGKALFKQADKDKDAFLTREEFLTGLMQFANIGVSTTTAASKDAATTDAKQATDGTLNPDQQQQSQDTTTITKDEDEEKTRYLTPAQLEALFIDTDVNHDGKVSWAEFNYRFCGGPLPADARHAMHGASVPSTATVKHSLALQSPLKKHNSSAAGGASSGGSDFQLSKDGKLSVSDMRLIVEQLWLGGTRHYKTAVELTKQQTTACSAAQLKKLVSDICRAEKDESKAKERQCQQWAVVGTQLSQKDTDRLFAQLANNAKDVKTVDLTPLFEQAKQKPAPAPMPSLASSSPKGKKGSKKKATAAAATAAAKTDKNTGPVSYTLLSVKADNVRDFVSDQILRHMSSSVKCHPPLKHYGDAELAQRALSDSGYRTHILLSERTKIKRIVRVMDEQPVVAASAPHPTTANGTTKPSADAAPAAPTGKILIFAVFRTEYTAMARIEYLYHARLQLSLDESVEKVEYLEKKTWTDGELDRYKLDDLFPEWHQFVSDEDEMSELSIAQQL